MIIERIEIRIVDIPFRRTYATGKVTMNSCNNVIISLFTDNGIIGYGGGAPFKSHFDSPIETVALCIEKYLAPAVIGLDPRNIAQLHFAMDKALVGNGYAKAAIDIAAYDAGGKSLGVPVYSLLGGRYRSRIPLSKTIGIKSFEEAKKEAAEATKYGFKELKVKMSGNPEVDIPRVKAIREAAGSQIPIRVDSNGAYPGADVAIKAFRIMETFDLELIEQPLPRWDFEGMAEMCRVLDTPIVADESLYTIRDAPEILKRKAADVFNIKVQKVGGLYRSFQIMSLAECANMPILIGTNIEAGISQSASVHIAAACPTLRYCCDMANKILVDLPGFPPNLVEDIIKNPLVIEGGDIICPEKPGLGVEVDERILDKYTHQRVVVKKQ